jgi:hypothetical protein
MLNLDPSRFLAELARRGEFVKSAASTLEAPVVRAIHSEFAPAVTKLIVGQFGALDLDASCLAYGALSPR